MTEDPQDSLDEIIETTLLDNICSKARFAPGDELRRKGVHYRDMYLVTHGWVEVQLQSGENTNSVFLGPGSTIGEIGFLKGCHATATVTAKESTDVLVINDSSLWQIEREQPDLAVSLLRALARTSDQRVSFNADLNENQKDLKPSSVKVFLCRNSDRLHDAQHLRYRVYCEELKRSSPNADHDKRIIRDNLDDFGHTFLAVRKEESVGTLRCNFPMEGPIGILEKLYGMNSSLNHPEHTMICTKLIVRRSRRGGMVIMSLITAMTRYALDQGARECFIDCIPELEPMYRRAGFEPAEEEFFHYENGPSLPMVLDVTKYSKRYADR